uniref:Putative secreted protein n=1 Tax=Anopheles darlingi TaxID=43151 RepID=A0A2M4DAC5_ANODA
MAAGFIMGFVFACFLASWPRPKMDSKWPFFCFWNSGVLCCVVLDVRLFTGTGFQLSITVVLLSCASNAPRNATQTIHFQCSVCVCVCVCVPANKPIQS